LKSLKRFQFQMFFVSGRWPK